MATPGASMFVWLETVAQDLRYAVRALRKTPVVTPQDPLAALHCEW